MSPKAQQIAIAKACGVEPQWLLIKGGYYYRPNAAGYTAKVEEAGRFIKEYAERDVRATHGEVSMELAPLPDYLNDRNEMAKVKAILSRNQRDEFIAELRLILNNLNRNDPKWYGPTSFDYNNATAAQEAQAFILTMNLWVEEAT